MFATVGSAQIKLEQSGSWFSVLVNNTLWGVKVQGAQAGERLFKEAVSDLQRALAGMTIPEGVLSPKGMLSQKTAQWVASMVAHKATEFAKLQDCPVTELDATELFDSIQADSVYAAVLYAALGGTDAGQVKEAKRPKIWYRPPGIQWSRLCRQVNAYVQTCCINFAQEGHVNSYWGK